MTKRTFWILAVFVAWFGRDGARAQQTQPVTTVQPNGQTKVNFPVVGSVPSVTVSGPINNQQIGADGWILAFAATSGISAISIEIESAPAGTNATTPGTFVAFAGTIDGTYCANPCAVVPGSEIRATGWYPWIRVKLLSATGDGTVTGTLNGTLSDANGATVIIAPGTICPAGTPCVVDGPNADGTVPTFSPVLVAGYDNDGGHVKRLATDSQGGIALGSSGISGADGQSNDVVAATNAAGGFLTFLTYPFVFNGTTWDRARGNTVGAFVQGSKTNNAAVPGANNLGVLPALANAAAPTWTEGDLVLSSVDLSGNQRVTGTVASTQTATSTALADGASNTEPLPTASAAAVNQRTFPMQYNGSTWDRQFVCNLKASVTLADATVTKIVAESGSTIIRVCHIHMTTTAAETFTISQGTGAACVTGLTTIDKYLNSVSLAMDFQPTAALRASASAGLCVNQSGTQAAEVTVIYAQF